MFVDTNHGNAIGCRIGDPEGLRGGRYCNHQTTEFGLGKLFFQKAYPLLTFKQDETVNVSFINHYDFPSKHGINLLKYWWILLIVLVVLIVIFLVVKKKSSDEEYEAV